MRAALNVALEELQKMSGGHRLSQAAQLHEQILANTGSILRVTEHNLNAVFSEKIGG